jgi:hypothetical protein
MGIELGGGAQKRSGDTAINDLELKSELSAPEHWHVPVLWNWDQ